MEPLVVSCVQNFCVEMSVWRAAWNHCSSGSYTRCGPEMIIDFQICTFVRTIFRRMLKAKI